MTSITPVPTAAPNPRPAAPAAAPAHPGLDPNVAEQRLEAGRVAEYQKGTLDPGVIDRGAPAYFRTADQIHARLKELAGRHPNLLKVADIGDSSEKERGQGGTDILVAQLGNHTAVTPTTPRVQWIAGMHAREIANPAMMMRFIEQALEGYGTDPELTALLDTRQIDIVPLVNPDGYRRVENGFAPHPGKPGNLMHRKNTMPPDGTDLNRNFDFRWGGNGASSYPRSQTYRGAAAASEPEVRALQTYASENTPNLFIDWHSYSELVLFPWGDTRDKAPDYEGLKNIAERFAQYNHYTPKQSIGLYPTSGTSKDFMYGKLGVPGFTIETGRSFHMGDSEFDKVWAENAPVMRYSAKIADAPYERVKGPDALDVVVDPASGRLQATVSDKLTGGQAIAGAEAVLDPSAPFGSGVALTPADGSWDGVDEVVAGTLDALAAAAAGRPVGAAADAAESARQLVFVRAKDAAGNWGPATAQWLAHPSFGGDIPTQAGSTK